MMAQQFVHLFLAICRVIRVGMIQRPLYEACPPSAGFDKLHPMDAVAGYRVDVVVDCVVAMHRIFADRAGFCDALGPFLASRCALT
jgi:hypothetical protein